MSFAGSRAMLGQDFQQRDKPVVLSTRPSNSLIRQKNTQPLLDLSVSEKAQMITLRLIDGFAFASGVPEAAEAIFPHFAEQSAIAASAVVGGLGVIGSIVGGIYAYQQIQEEREKVIKLNKEFFLLFNLAADKYRIYQKHKNFIAKLEAPNPEQLRLLAAFSEEYDKAIRHIQKIILPQDWVDDISSKEEANKRHLREEKLRVSSAAGHEKVFHDVAKVASRASKNSVEQKAMAADAHAQMFDADDQSDLYDKIVVSPQQEKSQSSMTQTHARMTRFLTMKKQESVAQKLLDDVEIYTEETLQLRDIIEAYEAYRKNPANEAGRKELQLWRQLKAGGALSQESPGTKLLTAFLDNETTDEVRRRFEARRDTFISKYAKAVHDLEKIFAKDNHDRQCKEKLTTLIATLQAIQQLILSESIENNVARNSQQFQKKFDELLTTAYENYSALYSYLLTQGRARQANQAQSVWIGSITTPLLAEGQELSRSFQQKAMDITKKATEIFVPNGSFRTFLRAIPAKKAANAEKDAKESMPINFDHLIVRDGNAPQVKLYGPLSVGVAWGLWTTGKSVYALAVSLGATALACNVAAPIIIGVAAVALTLMYAYLAYRTMKTHNDRERLAAKLAERRRDILGNESLQQNKHEDSKAEHMAGLLSPPSRGQGLWAASTQSSAAKRASAEHDSALVPRPI